MILAWASPFNHVYRSGHFISCLHETQSSAKNLSDHWKNNLDSFRTKHNIFNGLLLCMINKRMNELLVYTNIIYPITDTHTHKYFYYKKVEFIYNTNPAFATLLRK